MLLARRGLSVLVVDRSRYGADTLSTHALTRPAVLQLSRWGLLDAVRAAGTPRVNAVTYAYDDGELTIELPPSPEIDGLYAPRRTVIDPILVDAAVTSGATVRHEASVRALVTRGERVVGVDLEHRDRRHRVRCDLVVGADGARSTVARRTGATFEHTVDHSSACIYGFIPGLPDDAYRTVFRNGLAAGLIPTNDGLTNVWVSMPAHRFRRDTDHAALHHRLLTEADPESAAAVRDAGPLLGLRGFAGLHGFTRTATGPGWALVGDACDFKDPLSAHGITDALIAAELLAGAVTDLRHDTQADALASYSDQRHALAALMRPAVDHLATFAWTAQTARAALKQINAAMHTEWATIAAWDSGTTGTRERCSSLVP
jgi:flavin-dependent dehydrogenase